MRVDSFLHRLLGTVRACVCLRGLWGLKIIQKWFLHFFALPKKKEQLHVDSYTDA